MAPVNDKMNGGGTLGALSSHELIEVHCHSVVEKLLRSHKALKMVPLEQSKWILKLQLLSHGLNVEIKFGVKWPSFTIWIALNKRLGNHKLLDDGFRGNARRMLRISRGLRLRLWMLRHISRAWGPSSLRWNMAYSWLRGWRSWWSPCRVSALRWVRGHPTLKRRNGRGLRGLRWILRREGSWPGLARYWRVGMASSDARHGWTGVRGVGRLFKWLVAGRPLGRKLIRKVVKGLFHNGEWGMRNDRLWRSLNRIFKWPLAFLLIIGISYRDRWNSQGCEMGFWVTN